MTLKQVIDMADDLKPNAYSVDTKTGWVNEVEGVVQTEVFLLALADVVQYTYATDQNDELLVPPPHNKLYRAYLCAMIDYANGEYDKYENSMAVYNSYLGEYVRWYARTYHPADGDAETLGYYLSAYAIAVKHGYEGTEEAWLASLVQAMLPNRNLLDNGDFGNPVNQRGLTTYSGAGYTIDRWKLASSGHTLSVGAGYITLSGTLRHYFERPTDFSGQTVTFSAEVEGSGTVQLNIYSQEGSANYSQSYQLSGVKQMLTMTKTIGTLADATKTLDAMLQNASALKIYRVKLELGSVSTLESDPPADYGAELRKCQRYYCRGDYQLANPFTPTGSTAYLCAVQYPVQMRVSPAVVISDIVSWASGEAIAGLTATKNIGGSGGFNSLTLNAAQVAVLQFSYAASADL